MIFTISTISTQQNKHADKLVELGFVKTNREMHIDSESAYMDFQIELKQLDDLITLAKTFGTLEVSFHDGKNCIFMKDWESV